MRAECRAWLKWLSLMRRFQRDTRQENWKWFVYGPFLNMRFFKKVIYRWLAIIWKDPPKKLLSFILFFKKFLFTSFYFLWQYVFITRIFTKSFISLSVKKSAKKFVMVDMCHHIMTINMTYINYFWLNHHFY